MADAARYPAYTGQGAPAAFGWYPSAPDEAETRPNRLSRCLWVVVAVLGLSALGVDVGSSMPLGSPVRFGVLAAVVAVVGLLPAQGSRAWVVVALAVTGFLDALSVWMATDGQGWPTTAIMALTALQALVAVAALLHAAKVVSSPQSPDGTGLLEYVKFVQAYQAYATKYQQAAAAAYEEAAGQAEAAEQAPADVRTTAHQDPTAALQAKYARFAAAARLQHESDQGPVAPADHVGPGFPYANHAAPERPLRRGSSRYPVDGAIEMEGP